MKNDFLKELGYLGVTARLKRLNDLMSANIKEFYKVNNVDIEPSWHLVFLFLDKVGSCSMLELAEGLHLSQPALTKMIGRMEKRDCLLITRDGQDSRKKILQLSQKAKLDLPLFKSIWQAGQNSIRDILENNQEFMASLDSFEHQVKIKSFKDRALEHFNNG